MSSMQATPPFHPPSDETEAIGPDSATWASDEREGPNETSSPLHDQPHPDELQPIRDKRTDADWENVGPAAMVRRELHRAEKSSISYQMCCYNSDL